ncbi:MAG: RNA methyltransferase [Rhabdochlamydiaceae bacterium]|nr:RNA methyltransferase [Candidatus Amphrikana amoebophyrae]
MHTRFIRSLQHPIVKHLTKLNKLKPYRIESNSLILQGDQVIKELSNTLKFKCLLHEQGSKISFKIDDSCEVYEVSKEILKKISNLSTPQSLLAEVAMPSFADKLTLSPLLILDQVSDPGNLGTLIRSALAFNFTQIVLLEGCCDPFNDKALRSARGATFFVSLFSKSLNELKLDPMYSGFTLYSADMKGENIKAVKPQMPYGLVMGHESKGISDLIKNESELVSIKMDDRVESLNVGVAGSILMHEFMERI